MPTPARLDTHKKVKGLQTPQSMVDLNGEDSSGPIQASSFRNVSSCTRCRQRKSRCDQQLPQCGACEKAGARCVGYDPLMKREVPRSYLYYLEDRINYFKNLLSEHGVQFEPDTSLRMERSAAPDHRPSISDERDLKASYKRRGSLASNSGTDSTRLSVPSPGRSPREVPVDVAAQPEGDILHSTNDPGCCTAHELLCALQPPRSMTQCPTLPNRDQASKLINFYFEQGYPQVPALHKGELAQLLNTTYSVPENHRPYGLFLIYIVFAIGACIMTDSEGNFRGGMDGPTLGSKRKRNSSADVHPAEEYYTAAITQLHLAFRSCNEISSKLEGLEAAVLVAHLSLFYPVRPGPAYLVGLALRAAVDVKLYDEASPSLIAGSYQAAISNEDSGQQDQLSEHCQRLWWSAYSLDRLVSPYTGRPFAIPDHLVTMGFSSVPEEMDITCHGISPNNKLMNFLTSHLLQLRLLQSEIHEVLQYHHAQTFRNSSSISTGTTATTVLSSPLDYFESFGSWKRDINRRLDEWKSCIPSREETGTWVPIVRLELDYWKTINLLYRHEVKVPSELAGMLPPSHMNATHLANGEGSKDDFTHFKIVEASRKVLQSYRLVHHLDSGNCTFLATHNIFLAGTLFLFAIWNSQLIRNLLVCTLPGIFGYPG
ncbi:fungal-specific transcription factor domain-containing protein [Aspergillus ambiguus]|uniref:Zn(II)2Cys6 transcription factor n=1 Tax=Aspergillus ambiguus TaxID=176160 RepID=UPI003CCDFF2F